MSTEDLPTAAARHWRDCADVHEFLEQVRLRPGMWLPGGSLQHLQSMLIGYRVALAAHGVEEPWAFWPEDDFGRWLQEHRATGTSLDWAAAIERDTPEGSTPVEEFFRLLDAYRSETGRDAEAAATTTRLPGIEYMINAPVTLFWRERLLAQAADRLEGHGFRVIRLAADRWESERDMHRAMAAALGFPDDHGHNLDALNDRLGEVACYGGHDGPDDGAGLVLALSGYDRFAAACPRAAQNVLDIVADQAREAAELSRRLIALVQSGDPRIRFEPVGATPVRWNDDEALEAHRR